MCGNIGSRFGGGNKGEGRCYQLTDPGIVEGYLLRAIAQIGEHEYAKAITSLKKALDAMGYGKPTGSVKSARVLHVVSCLCLQAVCHEKLFLDPEEPDLCHAGKALSLYVSSWKSLLLVCGRSPDGYNVEALTASPLGAHIGQRILSIQQVLLRQPIAGRAQEPPPALRATRATTVTKESVPSLTTSISEYLWSHPTCNRVQKGWLSMGYLNRDKSNRDKSFSSHISLHVSSHDINMSMQCSATKTVECGEQVNLSKSLQKLRALLHHGDRDDQDGDGIRSEIDAFVNAVRDLLLMDEDAACVAAPASSSSKNILLPLRVFDGVWDDESRGFPDPSSDPMWAVAPVFFSGRVFCHGELEGRSLEGSYHGTHAMLSTADALHEVGSQIGTTFVSIFFLSFYALYPSLLICTPP
jgi:hypothetical protein